MSRKHGRNGRILIALTSGGVAEPLTFVAQWGLDFSTPTTDVTAMGDANQTFLAGLPASGGDFSGFWDDASVQTYTAATDGIARKFYLYPDFAVTTIYWFGTVLPDVKYTSSVSGAIGISGKWVPASTIARVG